MQMNRIVCRKEDFLHQDVPVHHEKDLGLLQASKCILQELGAVVSRVSRLIDKERVSVTANMGDQPKICILGAGFSGMCAGIKLKEQLGYDNYTIYDVNGDFGGTWLTQTYPGCACDVPSHLYSFSFELNPDWSTTYARQPEILEYIKKVATKYNLYSKAKFHHKVETAKWNEIAKKWMITVRNMNSNISEDISFDLLIVGTGPFGNANIPEQFLSFKGPLIHSSKWNPDVELDNKVVAIIGSGASAVQIIPQIVSKVKKLVSFQRRPAWVTPLRQHKVPSLLRTAFRVVPGLLWLFRLFIFISLDMRFILFKAKSIVTELVMWLTKRDMMKVIKDQELVEKLTPDYRIGCKRITPSNAYYQSLISPKCEVVRNKILSVNDTTITTDDGRERSVDVMILATGYRVQDLWSPTIIRGRSTNDTDSISILKAKGVPHYLGIVSSELPNAFVLLGPNTAYGHNSVVFSIECQIGWIMQVLREMKKQNFKMVCVKEETEMNFREEINKKMKDLVWGAHKCDSWYVDSKGINTTIHPGNATSYWRSTKNVDFTKLNFE